ncbi:MAG TPA: ChbG/HpnK family deacetylase [Myxococcaceae bacterium]|nr:ChbG/HpnK family deacetylase [Myxococcaceae bacterium]
MSQRRLIINADDLGYDPAVTDGILRAMAEGVVTSTTLMVNTPHTAEAASRARALAVGLHLNLARWKPLSPAIPVSLLGRTGDFVEANAPGLPVEAVKAEALAQLAEAERLLGRLPTHVDVHKHLHTYPNILEGVGAAARERGLPVRSIDAEMRSALELKQVRTSAHFIGEAGHEAYWTLERFRRELEQLPDGVTELMCHPGLAPTHVASGYSQQREVELQTFLHPGARAIVQRLGIQLTDFRAV